LTLYDKLLIIWSYEQLHQ